MVDNVIMPPIGQLMSGVDFSDLFVALDGGSYESIAALTEAGAPAIKYGMFINDVISFVILGFVVFMFVRQYNKMKTPAPDAAPVITELDVLKEIRDAMSK
jgi:large conductance mechanosensitive channel